MSERGHRTNWICPETMLSRYPSPLSAKQARQARRLISSGKMTHQQAAEHFGCELAELVAKTERKRGKDSGHGNAVLNVRPELRDDLRDGFCNPDEPMHAGVQRLRDEHTKLLSWAKATGFPGFSSLSPEPFLT